MESAKNHIKDFLSGHGKHTTDVKSETAPAVTNETVTRTNENQNTTAVDREIHQDHHHTTVQPVRDSAVKAEQHHHNVLPTETREFEHDDQANVKDRLAAERSQFKDTSRTVDGGSVDVNAPTVMGEHVHHHVHETVQPVIQKEIIEPHITHTTAPVHEVHHNATKHHAMSTLPAMSREDFEKQGGSMSGGQVGTKSFAGEPELVQKTA